MEEKYFFSKPGFPKNKLRSPLLMLLLISTYISTAQTVLVPGKNSFEKKWIRNTSYKMTWYALKDTSRIEIGEVSTQFVTDRKHITMVTQVNLKNMKAPWIDSTIADIATLKPVRHSSYNGQRDMVLNFGKIITGFYNDKTKQQNTIIHDTATAEYFDSNLYPALISWLPLKEGYTREISIYDYNPASKMGILKASVKEVKPGIYMCTGSGIREVWIVTVTDEIANSSNTVSTYYIDKKDRRLWKQEISIGERKMLLQLQE